MVLDHSLAPVITLDGPSGSGKGTLAQMVAQHLGWHILDSGALYRLVGLSACNHGIALDNAAALQVLAENMDVQFIADNPGEPVRVVLEGETVTQELRTEEAGRYASAVAKIPSVRSGLMQRQLDFRQAPGLVADGRDMGTTIFPDAPLKIFLTASAAERARRRFNQLQAKGMDANLADLEAMIENRDAQDANRAASPLRAAEDAVLIDSTQLSIDEVFQQIIGLAQARGLSLGR